MKATQCLWGIKRSLLPLCFLKIALFDRSTGIDLGSLVTDTATLNLRKQ